MKKFNYIFVFGLIALFGLFALFSFTGQGDFSSTAYEASTANVPTGYNEATACDKQEILWQRILASKHATLPDYDKFGIGQLIPFVRQNMSPKENLHSDFAPAHWKKLIHGRASVAKVKIVSIDNKYSGIFAGADCALLRLSLTYKPGKALTGTMPVAPGLALKVLRDGMSSANVSALVSLEGQENDFNFFAQPMSNIVPFREGWAPGLIHKSFARYTSHPEELLATDLAAYDQHGKEVKEVVAPRQLFFETEEKFNFSSDEHDVRNDFAKIPAGTVIYKVYATTAADHVNMDYNKDTYNAAKAIEFRKTAVPIANIVTTSEFVASEFGDSGIFFRHQMKPKTADDKDSK